MAIEYAVMRQVGDNKPEVYADGYSDRDKAWEAMNKVESNDYYFMHEGINVKSAAEARRVAEQMEEMARTRYYLVKREVSEWEED